MEGIITIGLIIAFFYVIVVYIDALIELVNRKKK